MKKKFSELTIIFTLLASFVLFGTINCFAYSGMVKPVDVQDYNPNAVYNPVTKHYPGITGTGTWDYTTMHRDNEDDGAISGCNGEGCGSHPGVDIPTTSGTEVVAIADGVVFRSENILDSKTGKTASWGGLIIIKHDDIPGHSEPIWSICAHLKVRYVNKDVVVKKGQAIGLSGGDKNDPHHGNSTAAHLHFQIDRDTRADTGEGFTSPYWPSDVNKADVNNVVDNYCYNPILFIQTHQTPMPQNSTFIKFSGNPAVYFVFKNQIWPIRNETTFKNMGNSDFSKVVEYPASQYGQIVEKFPIKRIIVNEHLIAKLDCNPKIYRFTDGKWHCFSDWDVFTSWGYCDNDIVEIPQAVFNMYPEGTKLATKAYAYIVPLVKEWNYSLGHSFADSIAGNSDSICIEYQGKKVSISQAIANGWTYKTAYGYKNEFFDFTIKDGKFDSGTMYFIYSFVTGAKLHMYGILQPEETQAVKDMDKTAAVNNKLSFKELYSLQIIPDWDPSWNLRVMSYKLSSSQTEHTWFNHATSKSNSSIRYATYKDPSTGKWTNWERVY